MYFVYVLISLKDKKRYIGLTDNLEKRIVQHNRGEVKSTRHRRPLKLIYYEKFNTKKEGAERERFFKTGKGREFLNQKNIKYPV